MRHLKIFFICNLFIAQPSGGAEHTASVINQKERFWVFLLSYCCVLVLFLCFVTLVRTIFRIKNLPWNIGSLNFQPAESVVTWAGCLARSVALARLSSWSMCASLSLTELGCEKCHARYDSFKH